MSHSVYFVGGFNYTVSLQYVWWVCTLLDITGISLICLTSVCLVGLHTARYNWYQFDMSGKFTQLDLTDISPICPTQSGRFAQLDLTEKNSI